MAHEPTQHPNPVAPGGTRMTGYRTLRGALGTDVRQPDLGGAPAVQSIAGFGAGAGAYIRNQGSAADRSQGIVIIKVGLTPAASGSIVLLFPQALGVAYWAAAEWASVTLTPAGAVLTINWTATRPLLPNETIALAYQWAVSQ
jgi:hypothetical protein